jgi:TetR/AcrR family transcriptional regulator, cholesterol catabolism regulator
MNNHHILLNIRDLSIKNGISCLSFEHICKSLSIDIEELKRFASTEQILVEKLLEFERETFNSIFDKYNFEGVNAIDILLTVSSEVSRRFNEISPLATLELQELYPEVYQHHIEQRIDFIFEKIKINIQKGIAQGMYRNDLSIELLSRLYISRLIDLHNAVFFPPEKFSFKLLFEVMFENFIRGIATEEGLKYYGKRAVEFKKVKSTVTVTTKL